MTLFCPPYQLGITGSALIWLESWGDSSRFAEGEDSELHEVIPGVPQGSGTGPLLFSIYTNISVSRNVI